MFSSERARQLLGGTPDDTLLDRIDKACLTFRFDLDSLQFSRSVAAGDRPAQRPLAGIVNSLGDAQHSNVRSRRRLSS